MANKRMELKNCYIPSDAYYVVYDRNKDVFMCPDSSINIVNAIKKNRELNNVTVANIFDEVRKSDTFVSKNFVKIRGNMFYPVYNFIKNYDEFNMVKDSISMLFPGIKTFDDLIEHNKKLAKKTLDKLFGEDLCYIVVNLKASDGDFLTCEELIPANSTTGGDTGFAIAFFENVLENGFYKTT